MYEILWKLNVMGVIPVVSIPSPEDAPRLGEALLEGGLPCAEITFRTSAAAEAIRNLVQAYPEMLVGAGTVLSIGQAETAVDAGAKFIVSPGFDQKIVTWCIEKGVAVTPGIATPTEINMALEHNLKVLKFFPAEAFGGVKTLKAISAPFREVKFIPAGGINQENLADYLRLPTVIACGGSWLVKRRLIEEGKFKEITNLTIAASEIVKEVRSGWEN